MTTGASRGTGALPPSFDAAAEEASPSVSHGAPLAEPVARLLATLRRTASNYATLAVLDVRRAAVQLAWLVAGCIFISVLVVTAWLAAAVALAVVLLGAGMSWPAVLLIAGALNLAGVAIAASRLRSVLDHAPFEATLRQLQPERAGENR